MKMSQQDLKGAVADNILTQEQAGALWEYLKQKPNSQPGFNATSVLYYAGGLLAIGAMSLFMTLGWEAFGGWGIFFISLLYAGVALKLSSRFASKGFHVPAGICSTFVIALTPLGLYGLQVGLGWWPNDSLEYREYHRYIRWEWIYLEFGTLAVGTLLAWRDRYPFMLMPIAVTLWYLSMDISVMLAQGEYEWELRKLVSVYFGLLMIGLAFWVDIRTRSSKDYAFWLYLFGVLTFWCGLSLQNSDSELNKFLYFCINLALIFVGVLLVRKVFLIFGALGATFYIGHLAWRVFEDSLLFPVVLTVIGFGIIYLGILWQRHESLIAARIRRYLPLGLREMLERRW